ncbi:carboxymuconolactone decarboxylase family protein [Jatrophihabitans cynanchi]|uniref:Carboxymuconolactone decarboxylase family protein n=2 Tax=Jatrophihabitans cynanchi TaxID=2944128 RepID=A0ABY7JZ01_9ACTN|nr:carboxymuconolactone decarboxylase family protein [Jatrophihabitans sp. SB3-54]WAX57792.1 carboxymuconolactone decarboxylase family protein [Jatrophihabitans sp. SB3-54]
MTDTTRYSLADSYPDGLKAMMAFNARSHSSGLDPLLAELIKIRASQLNSCAFCLDMHTKDARALGETEQRIYALDAWRETPFFTPAERATLAFTEAVTTLERGEIPDAAFDELRRHFDEETVGKILIAIVVINSWNRLMIAQRPPIGGYVSRYQS